MVGLAPVILSEDYDKAVAQHADGMEQAESSAHRIRQIRQTVGL